jgi:3-deoxy-D-manno-octulosonate 8-phosphate phosphatase (KDO 8-P phosphatase)
MIKLIVLDVDGCLSDGKITYTADGVESKSFNVKDGLGITTWIRMSNQVAIITGRESKIVEKRAKELGVQHLFQGVKNKKEVLERLLESLDIKSYETAAIGDDLNDYEMLEFVGKSFTPNDGVDDIKKIVDKTLSHKGGDGAVREMIDFLIDINDQKELFLSFWVKG